MSVSTYFEMIRRAVDKATEPIGQQHDLFGAPFVEAPRPETIGRKPAPRRGYAAPPGTGPDRETCSTCKHACRFRRYAKCALRRSTWTGGLGTDILLASPACSKWEVS